MRPEWVPMRPEWVTVRSQWVTVRPQWVTVGGDVPGPVPRCTTRACTTHYPGTLRHPTGLRYGYQHSVTRPGPVHCPSLDYSQYLTSLIPGYWTTSQNPSLINPVLLINVNSGPVLRLEIQKSVQNGENGKKVVNLMIFTKMRKRVVLFNIFSFSLPLSVSRLAHSGIYLSFQ